MLMQTATINSPTLQSLIEDASAQLKGISHSPRLDVELLLAHVLKVDRSYFIAHADKTLSSDNFSVFNKLLEQRKAAKPIAYILGKKSFWTFEVKVNENTLVPRPETEILVEQALNLIPMGEESLIADICTGSGAIALAIAIERPNSLIHATDIDVGALKIAVKNKECLSIPNIDFFNGDLYSALPNLNEKYDVLLSNPPYIDKDDVYLSHPTMQHEPRHALIADKNGLAIIERLIKECHLHLKKEGYLILEHGHEQKTDIQTLCKQHHLNYILGCQDYQALDRISIIQYQ